MTTFVAIISGKGGVGKTTVAANLGSALSQFERNVTVLDANLATPHLGLHLGAALLPVTLHEVLKGKNHVSEAIYQHPTGLKVVPASVSYEAFKQANPIDISSVFEDLKHYSEVVLVDTPAGLGPEVRHILSCSQYVLIVTTPDLPAVTDAIKAAKLSKEIGVQVLGVILNQHRDEDGALHDQNIASLVGSPVLGVIPHDHHFRKSVTLKTTLVSGFPERAAAEVFKSMASQLIGSSYTPPERKQSSLQNFFNKVGVNIKYVDSFDN